MRPTSMCWIAWFAAFVWLPGGCVDPVEAVTPIAYYAVDLEVPEKTADELFSESSQFAIHASTQDDDLSVVGSFCEVEDARAGLLGAYEEQLDLSGDTSVIIPANASECDQELIFRVEVWRVVQQADCPPAAHFSSTEGDEPVRIVETSISEGQQFCESLVSAKYKSLPLTPGIDHPGLVEVSLD